MLIIHRRILAKNLIYYNLVNIRIIIIPISILPIVFSMLIIHLRILANLLIIKDLFDDRSFILLLSLLSSLLVLIDRFQNQLLQQNLLQTHSELCKEPSIHARTLRRHFIIPLIPSAFILLLFIFFFSHIV